MDKAAMIAKGHKMATANSGYSYNGQQLEQIINDGIIPEGATFAISGEQSLVYRDGCACCIKAGIETKRSRATEAQLADILIGHAVLASRKGQIMGKIG